MPGLANGGLGRLKDLYIAKKMEGLKTYAAKDNFNGLTTSTDEKTIAALNKLYSAADEAVQTGDEERAFVLSFRFSDLYFKVISKVKDRKYFDGMVSQSKVKKCIEQTEKLEQSLQRRYQLLNEIETPVVKTTNESGSSPPESRALANGKVVIERTCSSTDDEQVNGDMVTNNLMKCEELYEFLEDNVKRSVDASIEPVVLIIDCRSSGDFAKSQINLETFLKEKSDRVVLMNIAEEKLNAGLAITSLEKKLDYDAIMTLRLRKTVKKVIILDWTSTELPKADTTSKLATLFNALWKWDRSTHRIKTPPYIMKGGYHEWLMHYPQLTTDHAVKPPKVLSPTTAPVYLNQIRIDTTAYSLDYLNEPKPVSPTADTLPVTSKEVTTTNGGTLVANGDLSKKREASFDFESRFNSSSTAPRNAPGGAKLVPSFDRSTKPPNEAEKESKFDERRASEPIKVQPSQEELRKRKEREADEEMQRCLISQAEDRVTAMESLNAKREEELEKYRRENDALKSSRKLAPTGDILDGTQRLTLRNGSSETTSIGESMANGHNHRSSSKDSDSSEGFARKSHRDPSDAKIGVVPSAVRPRQTDRTLSESKSSLGPMLLSSGGGGGGLTRSFSSPNIAQLLAQEDEDGENIEPFGKLSRSSTNPPMFDRTLKPGSSPLKPFSSIQSRNRNFSPIYGITRQAITGLKNLGNTCFMNSIIQCLSSSQQLSIYFQSETHLEHLNRNSKFGSKGELAEEFGALIKQMWTCQYKSVAPNDMKHAVGTHMKGFVGCEQQDAHEFFTMFIDKISNDLNLARYENGILKIPDDTPTHLAMKQFWTYHTSRTDSVMSDLFDGLTMSTLSCVVCGKKSETFEVFNSLSLPIPQGSRVSLMDCLKLFSEPERLSGEAAWDCPTCKCKREATKRLQVCRLPQVLVIHFKRFSYDGMWRQKLQTPVDFPLTDLNLKNYRYINQTDPSSGNYDLYGIVNHYGTMEGGHYIAYCKHVAYKQKWYKYDDHEVSELSAADVKTQAAYILFYAARPD